MKTKNVLLLASQSQSRKELLEEMRISFKVIHQDADESVCDHTLPFEALVKDIALEKMKHVVVPEGSEGDICFVLTSDTLTQGVDGKLLGKPSDREDAIKKIKNVRGKSRTTSAFCLEKKVFKNGSWEIAERIEDCVGADHHFIVSDEWIETYLNESFGYKSSGSIAIEGFGLQFSQSINGSYSTIRGLPLFELRQALEKIGFFRD